MAMFFASQNNFCKRHFVRATLLLYPRSSFKNKCYANNTIIWFVRAQEEEEVLEMEEVLEKEEVLEQEEVQEEEIVTGQKL